ncbi:MAG: hypothetical protein KDK36_19745, partial [Leptospiraceae bacterium]|nr:hypothetical protein [Leptospiraceae bacterium]
MIHKYIIQVFDSPHWPSLRNVIETIVFSITDPSPIVTVLISFALYALLPLGMLYVLWLEKANYLLTGALFLLGTLAIIQAEPLQLYAFTGMIELQGALVFIFVAYFLAKYFQSKPFPENKELGWKVFLSTTLLYHSKYPYGYMLVLSLILLLLILNPYDSFQTFIHFIKVRSKTWKRNPRLYLILFCILALSLPSEYLKGKLPTYFKYLILVLISLDLFLYFKETAYTFSNSRVFFILKWVVFPILLWMLSQPDRFGSYAGQITHVESQGSNPGQAVKKDLDYLLLFVTEFLLNGFQSFTLSYLIFFSNLFISIKGYYDYLKKRKITVSFIFSILCIITFLELSFFTTTRLARHTYHPFPVMMLSLLLGI